MPQAAIAETVDFYRADAAARLDPKRRSALGQFMTATPLARFLASLFEKLHGDIALLDPGAGVGSLTAAFAERLCHQPGKPTSATFACYEIEPLMIDYLRDTLLATERQCGAAQIRASTKIHDQDFILGNAGNGQTGLFVTENGADHGYTHVIMNPPYRKIGSTSSYRAALRQAGLETSNLYTGFLFLAAQQLQPGGEMVAIVPRSFCNGPYFKSFRQRFLSIMSLKHIHVFESRNTAFRDDEVLQENIIIHAVKQMQRSRITITASEAGNFEWNTGTQECISYDMTRRTVPYDYVIRPDDSEMFINISINEFEQKIVDRMQCFAKTLTELGLEISTGPVVDFRLRNDLRAMPEPGTAPLLYAAHFRSGHLQWPKQMKKPNAIHVSDDSRRWLWPNTGHFVVIRRFTSKEERRRLVASLYSSNLPGKLIGFENHLNVLHQNQRGMPEALARGLMVYLNSSLVDHCFRQFNGHTQVNATDLRTLRYPDHETLIRMGRNAGSFPLAQQEIDEIMEDEVAKTADEENPLKGQEKIDDALEILKALGMPSRQQNQRSALTLLALIDLKPTGSWRDLAKPLMGITPIMNYAREHYGREYAPNIRETFRRHTMHQFVESGIAVYNPDQPDRPVNSPKACYQITQEVFELIQNFGTDVWKTELNMFLATHEGLAARWRRKREMQMVSVTFPRGKTLVLTPGQHSKLIKKILEEFAPRFSPGASVVYIGDTGDKVGHFDEDLLAELGVTIDQHGKMPDVVLYYREKNWLFLVESVTSHGPVDSKRHDELAELFKGATPGLIYVTAFPDRSVMGQHLRDISWETEVWCADSPDHLIHFNGERLIGPYGK